MNSCVFIGKFQPFHIGHFLVIKGMTRVCEKIVIAIGSSKEEWTKENPFSIGERREMIQRALQSEDIIPTFDVTFLDVPDTKQDADWVKSITDVTGDTCVVWTGNLDVEDCCKSAGIEVKQIKEVPGISATDIRQKIKAGDSSWKDKVPKDVAKYIEEIGGVDRIKEI